MILHNVGGRADDLVDPLREGGDANKDRGRVLLAAWHLAPGHNADDNVGLLEVLLAALLNQWSAGVGGADANASCQRASAQIGLVQWESGAGENLFA